MNNDKCAELSKKGRKSRGKQCAVFDCFNFEYERDKTKSKTHFFKFPTKGPKITRWCSLIKRQDGRDGFSVNNNTRICEEHFKKEDIQRSLAGVRCRLRDGAEPSLFSWTKTSCKRKPPKQRRTERNQTRRVFPTSENNSAPNSQVLETDNQTNCPSPGRTSDPESDEESYTVIIDTSTAMDIHNEKSQSTSTIYEAVNLKETEDKSTQTDFDDLLGDQRSIVSEHSYAFSFSFSNIEEERETLRERLEVTEEMLRNLKIKVGQLEKELELYRKQTFTLDKFKDDDAAIQFYTGFPTYGTLIAFHEYLEPKVEKLQYWRNRNTPDSQSYQEDNKKKPGPARRNSSINELFMVLFRIRVGLFVQDMADRFFISKAHFSKLFNTWINFLFFELRLLFPFPHQSLVRKNMPEKFALYPTTRAIIDCTEVFVEVPSSMLAQSQTWSSYKHHNTFKILVGISPNGQVIFVSKLWGGRVSDKQITAKSGFLDHIEPGDNIMADRGFDIQDLLPPGVHLNISPFKGSRSQLTAEEVSETVQIASVRIHVERAIGRIKNYHILDGALPLSLAHIADQLFTVCAYLTNFLPPLLPKSSK